MRRHSKTAAKEVDFRLGKLMMAEEFRNEILELTVNDGLVKIEDLHRTRNTEILKVCRAESIYKHRAW